MEYKIFAGVNSIACFPEPDVEQVIGYELHVDTSIRSGRSPRRHRDYAFGTGWVLKIIYARGESFAFGGNVYVDEYNPSSNISELYGIYETVRQIKDECHFVFGKIPLKIFCDNQKAAAAINGAKYIKRADNAEFDFIGKGIKKELKQISNRHSIHWMKGHQPEVNFENHFADKIAGELRFASEEHDAVLGKFHLLTLIYLALSKTHTKLIDVPSFFEDNLKNFTQINSFLEEDNAVVIEHYTVVMKNDDPFKTFWTVKDSTCRYRGKPIISQKTSHADSSAIFIADMISLIEEYRKFPLFDPDKTIYLHSESIKYHLSSFHVAAEKDVKLQNLRNRLLLVTFGLNIIPTGVEVNHDALASGEIHRILKTEKASDIPKRHMKAYRRYYKR